MSDATREALHTRRTTITGYRRSDGLYEVEGRLLDTKPFDFRPPSDERVVAAGQAVHDMSVRIVFDDEMLVHDVVAVADAAPYDACSGGPPSLKALIGARMSRGWAAEVKQRLAGAASCEHLRSLMVPMAATAFQAMTLHRLQQAEQSPQGRHPAIDSCIAYARDGEMVRRKWPTLFVAKVEKE